VSITERVASEFTNRTGVDWAARADAVGSRVSVVTRTSDDNVTRFTARFDSDEGDVLDGVRQLVANVQDYARGRDEIDAPDVDLPAPEQTDSGRTVDNSEDVLVGGVELGASQPDSPGGTSILPSEREGFGTVVAVVVALAAVVAGVIAS
jgi:hypothetical protein